MSTEGHKYVYFFGGGNADGNAGMKTVLGGKGANLAEMTNLGLPVPPGFTICCQACTHYYEHKGHPESLSGQVDAALDRLEKLLGKRFGSTDNPLLLSIRSGAPASMPGMMDTVLNLGLNDEAVLGLSAGGERFAWDSYRRFIQMYSDVVMGVDHEHFEKALGALKRSRGAANDTELSAADLRALVATYKGIVQDALHRPFPSDPKEQLWGAIQAVFQSFFGDRAIAYRKMEGIPGNTGTAVNVQAMVFGNMGEDCSTGVAFTRDPATGEARFFGEYLVNAQGEDVVAGIRTPLPLNGPAAGTLEKVMPEQYAELDAVRRKLELHYKEMQDIEFTVEKGRLYMLQTRTGKRTAAAAVKIAVDMVDEGLIDIPTAIRRVKPEQIELLLHPRLDPKAKVDIIAEGLGASPGAGCGELAFTAEAAVEVASKGRPVVLMRPETSPEDIAGMAVAAGIVTARGGATSHAAVVARGIGKPCVAGCGDLQIDEEAGTVTVGGRILLAGDMVTIEGAKGWVIAGKVPTIEAKLDAEFGILMGWADEIRRLGVRANADTPRDSQVARDFGAEGIGLCRTEHMFFEEARIRAVREMILADNEVQRRAALAKILPMQRDDFYGIFKAMKGFPCTIRLLDPPLHEFLPHTRELMAPVAAELGVSVDTLATRVEALKESNPMLGHRGCRLAITYPEIAQMQTDAIISAACKLVRDEGFQIVPEIMIPFVSLEGELERLREVVTQTADRVIAGFGVELTYTVGTMIELPRAAVTADEIAKHADFFSFGTNDLTQTTFGLSRDDTANVLAAYVETGLLPGDPFKSIDTAVAALVRMGVEKGRSTNPGLKVGICGEHGGDPRSVKICHAIGLNYVSCSPFRVPVARMAAAHAVLEERK